MQQLVIPWPHYHVGTTISQVVYESRGRDVQCRHMRHLTKRRNNLQYITMVFNQFFILSPRGDTIVFRDYRGDAHPTLQEDFFRRVKFWSKGDCVPVFHEGDFIYMYIKRNNLLLCATTKYNVSPCTSLELLNRMAKVFKDYCGVLTEESIRKNFIFGI